MFPARGLGGQAPTGSKQEAGPTNPTLTPQGWRTLAEKEISGKVAFMEETLDAVQSVYDQDPAMIAKFEEEAGFHYGEVVAQLGVMKEEEAKLEETLLLTDKMGKYGKRLDNIRRKMEETRARLEALGYSQNPDTGGNLRMEDGASMNATAEEMAELQPAPQTLVGQAALAQREDMKEQAVKRWFSTAPQFLLPELEKAKSEYYGNLKLHPNEARQGWHPHSHNPTSVKCSLCGPLKK